MEDHVELNRSSIPTPFEEVQAKRKGTAWVKTWLVVYESGNSRVEEMGKQLITRRTGIPAQDLRVIEAELSYPSAILRRDRAIVLNLDHVKAIITSDEVLVPNPRDPYIVSFARDLELKLSNFGTAMGSDHQATDQSPSDMPREGSSKSPAEMSNRGNSMPLPFEFRALEICLESVCRSLESETSAMEEEAYPALDELSVKTSPRNLKRARVLKGRLVALSGRVHKVRDEFEHLLDDDADMAQLYLTRKLATKKSEGLANDEDELGKDANALEKGDDRDEVGSCKSSSTPSLRDLKPNVEEVEMLLGSYFVQIGAVLNKLSTMSEYVHDTEDYINIVLDDRQNQLLRMAVVATTGMVLMDAGILLTSIMAINSGVKLLLFGTDRQFYWTTGGVTSGIVLLGTIAFVVYKWKGIIG